MTGTIRGLDEIVRTHPFFEGLAAEYIALLVGCARNERHERGEFLYREGQPADRFYIMRHGQVRLEVMSQSGGALPIMTVGAGDVLGSSWIVPPYVAGCDARVTEAARAISFDGACMRAKCEEDPRLGYALMKRFAETLVHRLLLTRLQLLDVYGAPAGTGRRDEGPRARRR